MSVDRELLQYLEPDMDHLPRKNCLVCDKSFPVHKDYYHQDETKDDGFKDVCITCRAIQFRAQQMQNHKKLIDDFNKKMAQDVLEYAQQLGDVHGRRDNIGKLYESIVTAFGGIEKLGALFPMTFVDAPVQTRQRMLANIISLSKVATEMGYTQKNLEDMDERELLEEAVKRARAAKVGPAVEHFARLLEKHNIPAQLPESSKEIEQEDIDDLLDTLDNEPLPPNTIEVQAVRSKQEE